MKSKFRRNNFGKNLTDLTDKSTYLAYSVVYLNVSLFFIHSTNEKVFSNPSINQFYLIMFF